VPCRTKHQLLSGNQTLLTQPLGHKMAHRWVQTPAGAQKVWEVAKEEPRPTSTQTSVLDGLVIAGCTFHLGANLRGPKLVAAGLSRGSRQGVNTCSCRLFKLSELKAESFTVILIWAWEDWETVCAGDAGRAGGGDLRFGEREDDLMEGGGSRGMGHGASGDAAPIQIDPRKRRYQVRV